MLFVNHPVADLINDGLEIANELNFRIIKDETQIWFIGYDEERRGQELDETIMRNILRNRLIETHIKNDSTLVHAKSQTTCC